MTTPAEQLAEPEPPRLVATFESGSCGHVATRCECDAAGDLYFAPREA